ncbi:hypothetical protein Pst134EB_004080 [Puccinia striiformis f. sp. tritici]|nr:hypothetical protein Pst134EB_004080 [Puccinia striiformis f. sp. tritici]
MKGIGIPTTKFKIIKIKALEEGTTFSMSYSSRPISSSSHSNSTATTPKQRHLAHLATKLAELSIQTDRLASLCKVNARQHTDQHELAIYYGSMLMATTRVFNLDESNGSESDDQDNSQSSPNK